jgi:glutathione S-transferase
MMVTPVMAVSSLKIPLGPNTQAWLKRVRARPAFRRCMARMKDEEKKQMNKGKL